MLLEFLSSSEEFGTFSLKHVRQYTPYTMAIRTCVVSWTIRAARVMLGRIAFQGSNSLSVSDPSSRSHTYVTLVFLIDHGFHRMKSGYFGALESTAR